MKLLAFPLLIMLVTLPAFSLMSKPRGFCRGGQVFLTWSEIPDAKDGYVISRVEGDRLVEVARVPQGSGIDIVEQHKAERQKRSEEPRGMVILPEGNPLPPGTGLWVHTVRKSGKVTYRIAAAGGSEIGRITIQEKTGKPEPILESKKIVGSNRVIFTFIHWATPEISAFDGHPFKFTVQVDNGGNPKARLPLSIHLHGWGGSYGTTGWRDQPWISLVPGDFTRGLPFDDYDWWYGYSDKITSDIRNSTIVNYTERRLLFMIKWVSENHPVDLNRIYLYGSSMGGTGSIAFGLRHPEIFAAIDANVPQVNPGMDGIGTNQPRFEQLWGKREWKLKTNEGVNVWERLDMARYVSQTHADMPFLKTISGRNDTILVWHQIPPFYHALQKNRHGFAAFWGPEGHVYTHERGKAPEEFFRFDITRFKKNESYPAVSNLSINGNPGQGDPKEGDEMGFMNAGFDWEIIADTPTRWEILLKPADPSAADAVLDITPRRLQKFAVKKGVNYRFRNLDSVSGKLIQEGIVRPDRWNLLTLLKLQVVPNGNRVIISR